MQINQICLKRVPSNILVGNLYYLTVYGFKIVGVISTQYSPALQLPMDIVYLAVPIGGATMFIEALIIFLKTLGSPKESQILKETSTKNW